MTKVGANPRGSEACNGLERRVSLSSRRGPVRGARGISRGVGVRAGLLALALVSSGMANGATGGAPIFTCTDTSGKRVNSDRKIPNCVGEQRQLNSDGSLKSIVPPTLSLDEQAEAERRRREAEIKEKQIQEAIWRDRNLLMRFPNEVAHRKARDLALEVSLNSVKLSEARIRALAKERKPLMDEAEFYAGKPLPPKLKQALDANDAANEAQRSLIQNQQVELARINQGYDAELEHLKKLWGGAQPGSITAAASGPQRK
ncbi:hypothetical protein BH11PSE8_BH11PSE8_23260 [soil metagenome]